MRTMSRAGVYMYSVVKKGRERGKNSLRHAMVMTMQTRYRNDQDKKSMSESCMIGKEEYEGPERSTRATSLLSLLIVHPNNLHTSGHSTIPPTRIVCTVRRTVPKLRRIQDLFHHLLESLSHANGSLR